MKIMPNPGSQAYAYGRHFDFHCELVSTITRESLDCLKRQFKAELEADKETVALLFRLRQLFKIQGSAPSAPKPAAKPAADEDEDEE